LSLRPGTAIVGVPLLVGIGVLVGVVARGNAGPAAAPGVPSSAATPSAAGTPNAAGPVYPVGAVASGPRVIDMAKATGTSCRPPVSPGKGHPDTLLSQVFSVSDSHRTTYLLGWQIVPYKGARTYAFGAAGNLLALEPPTGGRPLGFGSGTVTFTGKAVAGTVHATVRLTAGGSVTVTGKWACSTSLK
jgi:hypothetical protein